MDMDRCTRGGNTCFESHCRSVLPSFQGQRGPGTRRQGRWEEGNARHNHRLINALLGKLERTVLAYGVGQEGGGFRFVGAHPHAVGGRGGATQAHAGPHVSVLPGQG